MRHRAIIRLHEEDLWQLFRLGQDERVLSTGSDWLGGSVNVLIEGPNLPESMEGTEYPRVERPFAMAEFRRKLLDLLFVYRERQGGYAGPDGALKFATDVETLLEAELLGERTVIDESAE